MNTYAIILSAITLSFGSISAAFDSPAVNTEPSTPYGAGHLDKMGVSPNQYLTPCPGDNNQAGFVNQSTSPSVVQTPSPADADDLDLVSKSALPSATPTPAVASPAVHSQTTAEGPIEPAMQGMASAAKVIGADVNRGSACDGVSPIVPMKKGAEVKVVSDN